MQRSYIYFILLLFVQVSFAAQSYMYEVVEYLASDKLEGRKSGQRGNELATEYLVKKMKDLGLDPLAKSHRQEFTIFTEMLKTGDNFLKVNDKNISFEPISYSLTGKAMAKKVSFVGFGISIPKGDPNIVYDDYAGMDVKDHIVVIYTGDPGIGNTNSVFRKPEYLNYSSLFYKLKNAIEHGASGVLFVQDPMSMTNYPSGDEPHFNATEGGGNRFSILSGFSTNKFLNLYLPSKYKNSLHLQKQIASTQKPLSMQLTTTASMAVHLKKKTGRVANIVGVIEGTDDKLKKEVIVIGGHMDHLGFGGESSMEPTNAEVIHNGADDNASGTAMVLALAKKIKGLNPKRTYVFTLFNAEEMGLLGATHFVNMWQRHTEQYGKLTAMLNFDMVGRYQKELSIMGSDSALEWKGLLNTIHTADFNTSIKKQALGSSDHAAFLNKKIPSLFFTTGAHGDYHRSTDDTEKIDFKAMQKTYLYALSLVKNMEKSQTISFNPNYNTNDGRAGSRGYGAHLGCVPEFGQSDEIIGVVCTGTSTGSPAEGAGVLAGDIIVQIGDIEINSIYDLAFALKYYRAGDKIELGWKRGNTLMKSMITLARSRR